MTVIDPNQVSTFHGGAHISIVEFVIIQDATENAGILRANPIPK